MPRFLSRLAGVSLQTELLMMTLFGLANSILDWRTFDWSNQLKEIENLQPTQSDVEWTKIILKWTVIARILVVHVHTFSYLMNFYSILTWSRPHFLLPGIVVGFFKNLVLDGVILFVGIILWYVGKIPSLLITEFVIVKSIPLALSGYNWWSTVGFFKQLKRIERIRKMRKALLHSESVFGRKAKTGSDSFSDGSGTLLAKRQRCVSFLSFDDFFCQTSLDSLEVDQRISKSLTTLLTISSSVDSDETDDAALQIIEDPDLTPLEKSMKILGITEEDVRIARVKSRYTLAERANRKWMANGIGREERFFWKEDGQTQTARARRAFEEKRRKKREIVEEIKEREDEEEFLREEYHEDTMLKNIGQSDWNPQERKSEDRDTSLQEIAGVVVKEKEENETSEVIDTVPEDVEEEEITKTEDILQEIKVADEDDLKSKEEEITEKDHKTYIESSREHSTLKKADEYVGKEEEEKKEFSRKDESRSHYPCDLFVEKQIIVRQTNEKNKSFGKTDPEKQTPDDKWQICECPEKINNQKGNIEPMLENKNLIYKENRADQTIEKKLENCQESNLREGNERSKGMFRIKSNTSDATGRNSDGNVFFCNDIKLGNPRKTNLLHDMKNNHENVVIEVKNKIGSFPPLLYNKISSPVQFLMSMNEQFKANLCPTLGNYDYFETFLKFPFSTHEMYRRYGQEQEFTERKVSEVHYMIRQFGKDNYAIRNTSESRLSGGYTSPRTNNFEIAKGFENTNSIDLKRPGLFHISEFARNDSSRCPLLWPFFINQSTQLGNVGKSWDVKGNIRNPEKFQKKDISTQVKTVRRSELPQRFQETRGFAVDSNKLPKLRTLKVDKSVEAFKVEQMMFKADEVNPKAALKCTPKEFITKHDKITNNVPEVLNTLLGTTLRGHSTSVQTFQKNNYVWERTDNNPEDQSSTSSEVSSPRDFDEFWKTLNTSTEHSLYIDKQPFSLKPPSYPRNNRNTNRRKLLANDNDRQGNNEPLQGKLANVQVQCSRSLKTRRKRESIDERKARELEALKAYNKVTLLEDKRRLEAKRRKFSSSSDLEDSSRSSGTSQIHRNTDYYPLNGSSYEENELESNDTSNRVTDNVENYAPRIVNESFDESSNAGIENEENRRPQVPDTTEVRVREESDNRTLDNLQSDQNRMKIMGNLMSLSFSENKHTLSKLQSIDCRAAEMILELLDSYETPRLKQELKKIQETRNQDTRKRYSRYSSSKKDREALDSSTTSCKRAEGLQTGRDLERIPAREDVRNETNQLVITNYDDQFAVHSVPEDNRLSTIKPYTRREASSLSTISMEPPVVEPEEIVTLREQERFEEEEVHEEYLDASANLEKQLRKSIDLNLPDIVRDIRWSFQPGGIVLTNKNLQQRSTNAETLLGVYPRDIVDDETASLVHGAFFTKPEVIIRTFRQERGRNGDEVVLTHEEAFNAIHQGSSVEDMVIRSVDEMNFLGGEEIYDSNLDNVQVNVHDLGNTLLRALRNSQSPDQDMIMIIEENHFPAESNRIGMDEQVQDFTLNFGCSERRDCSLKNGDNSRENPLEIPLTFWMNFLNGVEVIPNPEEAQSIDNKNENITVSEESTEQVSKPLLSTPEDEIPSNLEFSTTMKRSETKLIPIEPFNKDPGPSKVTKVQVSPEMQHSSSSEQRQDRVSDVIANNNDLEKKCKGRNDFGNIARSHKVPEEKKRNKIAPRNNQQGNLYSFPAQFEYAVVSHQPRRGHGLSSGYLMDFNSEGTLAVTQPTVSTNPSNISGQISPMSRNLTKSWKTLRGSEVSEISSSANNGEDRMNEYDPCVENNLRDIPQEKVTEQQSRSQSESRKFFEFSKTCIVEETEISNSEFIEENPVDEENVKVLKKNVEIQNDRLPLRTILMFSQFVFMFYYQYFADYFRRSSRMKSTKSTFTSNCYELHTVSTSTSRLFENYMSMEVPENWKTFEKSDKNIGNDFSSSTIDLTTKSFNNHEDFNSEEQIERLIEPQSAMSFSEEIKEITLEIKNFFSCLMDRFVEFVEDGPCELPSGKFGKQDYEPQKSFYLLEDTHEDIVTVHEEIDLEDSITRKDILPRIEEIVDEFPEVKEAPVQSVAVFKDILTVEEPRTDLNKIINSSETDLSEPEDLVQKIEENPVDAPVVKSNSIEPILINEDPEEGEREKISSNKSKEIDVSGTTNSLVAEEKTELNLIEMKFEDNDSFDSTYTRGSIESGNEISTVECSSMEEFSRNPSRISSSTQNSPSENLPEESEKSSKIT